MDEKGGAVGELHSAASSEIGYKEEIGEIIVTILIISQLSYPKSKPFSHSTLS